MPVEQLSPTSQTSTGADHGHSTAQLVLEDFVVTMLLRLGRALRNNELAAGAEGFTLSQALLREGLAGSERVVAHGRGWDLAVRIEAKSKPRDERSRRPLEGSLDELLRFVGKPLPLPAIVRELAELRGVLPDAIRDTIEHVLASTRSAIESGPQSYIHSAYSLDAGAPREEIVVRINQLDKDPAFARLKDHDFSGVTGSVAERAAAILATASQPISRVLLGFLIWKTNPDAFDARELAMAMADRKLFYSFVGGLITTQAAMPRWRAELQDRALALGHAAAQSIDVAAALKEKLPADSIIAPKAAEIAEIRKAALTSGQPISLVSTLVDTFEMEADDPMFVATLQGLNDALRRSSEFMPVGIGQFLLRETVPVDVGQTPASLRPVHLALRNPETNDTLDVEMSDEGLEGDAVDFVHAAMWEDIGEEVEVKLAKRPGSEVPEDVKYTVLYHHYKAGTLKLRRMDEDFFALQAPLTRINMRADDGEAVTSAVGWASRESGLIYGLNDWYAPRLPQSGGVPKFSRGNSGGIDLTVATPNKLVLLEDSRIAQLERFQERSAYLSLYDLLQSVLSEHGQGAELATIWAEVNCVRRTSKRLVCSVLAAYHSFYFKQKGPRQILWRFDEGKLDQGFKRNKRKFVRR